METQRRCTALETLLPGDETTASAVTRTRSRPPGPPTDSGQAAPQTTLTSAMLTHVIDVVNRSDRGQAQRGTNTRDTVTHVHAPACSEQRRVSLPSHSQNPEPKGKVTAFSLLV